MPLIVNITSKLIKYPRAFACISAGGALLAVSLVGILASTSASYASLEQCRALRTQLTSLRNGGGSSNRSSAEFTKYDRLAKRQSRALRSAQRDAVAQRCITRSGKRTGGGAASCPALLSKIKKMRRNLDSLTNRRSQFSASSSGGSDRAQRRAVRNQMSQLGCSSLERQARREARQQRRLKRNGSNSLLARLFGSRQIETHPEILEEQTEDQTAGGVFRTLCVRMSDGYYFPISFATVRSAFDTDDTICQASRLGEEMRLFFHRNPSEQAEDMVDLSGQAYVDLPNAFLYRTKVLDKHKFENRHLQPSGLITVAGALPNNRVRVTIRSAYGDDGIALPQKPSPSPNVFADPDSQMAEAGQFVLKEVNPNRVNALTENVPAAKYDPATVANNGVRVIGPTFLDDQESVRLLLTPDQIQVQ